MADTIAALNGYAEEFGIAEVRFVEDSIRIQN